MSARGLVGDVYRRWSTPIRFVGFAALFVPLGAGLLAILRTTSGLSPAWCVLVVASVMSIPGFLVNKLLVWRDESRERLRVQVMMFWTASVLSTLVATLIAIGLEYAASSRGEVSSLWLVLAAFAGHGVVGVARYTYFDRVVFAGAPPEVTANDGGDRF